MIHGMLDGRNQHDVKSNRIFTFEHNNLEQLEEKLFAEYQKDPTGLRIVAFESVHSMNGNIQAVGKWNKFLIWLRIFENFVRFIFHFQMIFVILHIVTVRWRFVTRSMLSDYMGPLAAV